MRVVPARAGTLDLPEGVYVTFLEMTGGSIQLYLEQGGQTRAPAVFMRNGAQKLPKL